MRIFFLIRRLGIGGAERQLVELTKMLAVRGHQINICTFYAGGELEQELADLNNILVTSLQKKGRWTNLTLVPNSIKAIRSFNPDIIHSYMEVSNIVVAVYRIFTLGRAKIIWGIRTSNRDYKQYPLTRQIIIKTENLLSRIPQKIIFNSQAGLKSGAGRNMPTDRLITIHNGIDTGRFHYKGTQNRKDLREELNLGAECLAIALLARFDPVKNHELFLQAASIFINAHPNISVKFLMFGSGTAERVKTLEHIVCNDPALGNSVIFFPPRADVAALLGAIDINTLTSNAEGFPNVLAEAMASGTPCVATDAGDSKSIIGENAYCEIVPINDPQRLSEAWLKVHATLQFHNRTNSITTVRDSCRSAITADYSLDNLATNTEYVMTSLLH